MNTLLSYRPHRNRFAYFGFFLLSATLALLIRWYRREIEMPLPVAIYGGDFLAGWIALGIVGMVANRLSHIRMFLLSLGLIFVDDFLQANFPAWAAWLRTDYYLGEWIFAHVPSSFWMFFNTVGLLIAIAGEVVILGLIDKKPEVREFEKYILLIVAIFNAFLVFLPAFVTTEVIVSYEGRYMVTHFKEPLRSVFPESWYNLYEFFDYGHYSMETSVAELLFYTGLGQFFLMLLFGNAIDNRAMKRFLVMVLVLVVLFKLYTGVLNFDLHPLFG